MSATIYDFEVKSIDGKPATLADYKGQVVLIVNTASKCGFTPQFKGLEALYNAHKDKGFTILGFPCNQFGHQDPDSNEAIAEFCEKNYGVSFPMHTKIDVNGDNADPLFQFLKEQAPGVLGSKSIKWNFTKFLVNREGEVVKRFASKDSPEKIEADITALFESASA